MEARARELGLARVASVLPFVEGGIFAEVEGGTWLAGPAVAVPIPLWNWGQGPRARVRAELRQVWDDYTATAIEVRAAVRSAYLRARMARRQAEYAHSVLMPIQEKISEQTHRQYNAMQVGVFTLLDAKIAELEVRQLYLRQVYNYLIAASELKQILRGRLVRDGGGGPQTDMNVSMSAGAANH